MESVNTANSFAISKRWTGLALLCAAQFMVIMDTSIIGVALPAIKQALGYSQSGLQWIFNAYVIVFGGALLVGGRLSDLFGAKKIFRVGFAILAISSLLAGLAWDPISLNIGRGLQGLGAALIAPSSMTLLMMTFTDQKELKKAFGFWGASAAAGGSAGVFLGGVITQWLSWRWTFLINIPVAIWVFYMAAKYLIHALGSKGKIDVLGSVLTTASLALLVYGIVSIESAGFASINALGAMAAGLVLLIMLWAWLKQTKNPLLPLTLFKAKNLKAGNMVTMLLAGAWIPMWFFLNLFLQQIIKLDALHSGLALLPMTIVIMITMVGFTEKIIAKIGWKSSLILGLILLTIAGILFSLVPSTGTFFAHLLIPSLIGALGMALAYIPSTIASISGAKPEETGMASGLVNTSYQIGSAIGLAITVAIAAAGTASADAASYTNAEALNQGFSHGFIATGLMAFFGLIIAGIGLKK